MGIKINKVQEKNKQKKSARHNSFGKNLAIFLNKDIQLLGGRLSDKRKEWFYAQFSILLVSGLDIKTSLELIIEELKEKERKVFKELLSRIISGATFSEAMQSAGKFSPFEYYSIKIGEESGKIQQVLVDLSNYYTSKLKQRRQIIGAFTYPLLVLFTAVLAVFFMIRFIVPVFEDAFKRLQGDLPPLTRKIISISHFVNEKLWLIFLVIFFFIIIFFFLKKMSAYKRISAWLILRLPYFGVLVKKIYLARFCSSMSMLLSSGTPLMQSVKLIRKMIVFHPYQVALSNIEKGILKGNSLYHTMQGFAVFDKRVVSLTKVGEEVNQLSAIYQKLYKQYNEEVEHRISLLNRFLEPLLIIIVGLLVAVILVSMYLPIFQLSTSYF